MLQRHAMLLGPCDLTSLIKNGNINSNNKKAGGLLMTGGTIRTVFSAKNLWEQENKMA
jgi:hypothetical protein